MASEKFKSIYRIESIRLRHWNYSSPGFYFITICTFNRQHFFGKIKNGKMFLNEIGKIAHDCWSQIPRHFENAELGDYVIMPNHVHGIIIINGPVETGHGLSLPHALSLPHDPFLPNQKPNEKSQPSTHFRFRNQGKNTVSAMVGSFKSSVTRLVKTFNKNFAWQTRFYDRVVRSEEEYFRISNYIRDNPFNWKDDRFY